MAKQTSVNVPQAWPWLQDLLTGPGGSVEQLRAFQGGAPGLLALLRDYPELNVPGLTPDQESLLKQMEQAGANPADLAAARAQLTQLTSGPIGSSPATAAGMEAFRANVLPQVMQDQALQGTATGGAANEAVANATSAAALPLIQQEIQNREAAVGQYSGLAQDQISMLASAFEASGVPREVALEQAQAAYEAAQGKFGFTAGLQTGTLSLLPSFIGGVNTSHSTMSGEDYLAAVGKGLSPKGLIGSFGGGGGGGQ